MDSTRVYAGQALASYRLAMHAAEGAGRLTAAFLVDPAIGKSK